jgi:hypothetical protein
MPKQSDSLLLDGNFEVCAFMYGTLNVKYHASHFNKPYKLFEEGVDFPNSSDIAL